MVEATRRAKVPNPVADSLSQTPRTTKQKSSSTFRDLLSDTANSSPANMPARPAPLRNSPISGGCRIGKQHTTPGAAARTHTYGSGSKEQSLVAIAMDQPVGTPATTDSTKTDSTAGSDPIASLVSAMNRIGIDSSQLTITPVQYNAFYPNGGYIDNEISVSTKDGRTVQLGLDLLQKNYDIGAWDVKHMLQATVQT